MTVLTGWGRHPSVAAEGTIPRDRAEASALSPALPRGLGRSYGDAALPPPGGRFLDTRRLDRFIAFDPATGTLEAEAGVTLRAVIETLLPRGWFPPVTPGTQWVTLGGAVASNVHGKNHHHRGSIEHFLDALEVVTPAGAIRCGPRENPELFRATVGGYGLTGLVTRVRLRMQPVPSPRIRTRSVRARNLAGLFAAFREHDAGYEYSVAWVDTLARGSSLGRGMLLLGDHAAAGAIADAGSPGRDAARAPGSGTTAAKTPRTLPHTLFDVPFPAPSGLLQPWAMRAFNGAYYHIPRASGERIAGHAGFFYPLDRIGHWNRLYGSRGFFQYQCVIPDQDGQGKGEAGVETCLRFLARHGMGSFLAVLKRCGDDTVMLPFCRRGFTLALDVPHRGEETLRRLADLDRIVLDFGGRVYLTKDARLSKETFRAMYPEWREWMATVKRFNPEGAGRSLMSERLGMWEG